MSELVRFLSGDNDVAQKTQMDPQNPTAKFVPLEPGQVLFGLEVVEDGSLLGTIYYDYKDKNGIITRVSMGNGGAGGSGGGVIRTLATTDGKHESDEVTATANTIIPLPQKIFANLLSAKTQFNFPKVHDPSNTAYVNEDAAPGQSYLYGNGLHMVNPFNTLQDSWIRTIGKSGSAEATLELAMRDNASNEYIYDQIVARHYKADGTIVTDTDGHKREVVILGKEGESQFPGPVTSQRGFVGDVDGNAKSATKAKQDWYDQVIDSTYLSKIVKTTHNGSKFEITSYDGRYTPVGSADAKKDVITIPGATTTLAGLVTTGDQTITGNKTIDSSGTLTIAKQGGFIYSGIQEDKATDKNLPLWFSTSTANGTPNYSTELTYNPSTGTVTAKKFAGPATSATYDAEGGAIHDKYLKRAGGTMTGALKFADNIYNAFGDDVEIGSQNAAGKLNIRGKNGATGIVFVPYSGSTSQTISIDGAGVMTITGTVKTTLDGNASTATTLKTARNFNITDSSAAYSGPNVSFNGSADVTLHMPDTFAGTLKGNADTATKLKTARTLWGQSFNGTANISGNMTGVGNVTSTKTNTYTLGTSSNLWKAVYATTFYGALSGNADTATKLQTARSFHITDSSATYNGVSATFDGSAAITLHMPDTFVGTLKGHADSSTRVTISDGSSDVERKILVSSDSTSGQNVFTVPGITANYAKKTLTATGGFIGNASSASKLETAKKFTITDSSAAYTGANASFDGTGDVTLHMPSTFAGTLKGNADTATKATKDANNKTISTEYLHRAANSSSTINQMTTAPKYLISMEAFADGGEVKWVGIDSINVGSADEATKLATARSFHITDSSATYNGASVNFDGTGDVTLHMPDTFAGTLKGNADSATKLKTSRTLWGQSFNGSANVTGAMSSVGNITSLKTNTHDIGSSSNVWKNIYATTFHGTLDGKATSAGSADMANQVTHVLTIEGQSYDGSTDVAVGNTIFYIVGNSTDATAGTWTGTDNKIKSYYNGLTIVYVPKVAGASTTTLNLNGLGAKTCHFNGTSKLTTHYPAGTPIMLTYIDGYWKRADYDSNTNTQIRVYRQVTSDSAYNGEYPLLVSRTKASSIGTADSDGSYTAVYGVMSNDTTKIPTINVHTGAITATSFKGIATNALNDANGNKIDETYVKLAGDTMTGSLTTPTLTLSSTSGVAHLKFSRANANYITAPASGYFAFLPNGLSVALANAPLVVAATSVYPGTTNVISLGTSTYKWKNVYATTFTGALSGNASTASKWQTARNFQVDLALDNPSTVAVDGSKDVILPVTGILGTVHGGTGNSSHTANRLVWTETATKLTGSYHYANSTQVAINSTAAPTGYNFLVSGKTHLNGDARVTGNLLMTTGGSYISWDNGTVQQRIITTDDSTADTAVFTFQQSENTASSWNNLLTIRDNGRIVLQNEKGGIYKLVTTVNTSPLIQLVSDNQDVSIFKVASGTAITDSWSCGFDLIYKGTGSGVNNVLTLYAGDYGNTKTQVVGWSVNQAGQMGIRTTPSTSYALNINGNTHTNGIVYINNSTEAGKDNAGALIVGPTGGVNLGIDGNEITARNNKAVSTLYLNPHGGLVQIGAGGLHVTGQTKTDGPLLIGSDPNGRGKNYIAFYGTTDDGASNFSHTFIGENLYSEAQSSELILFKGAEIGDKPEDMRLKSGNGPDRIRHIAAGHLFQAFRTTSAKRSGTFAEVCAAADDVNLVNVFEVNNKGVVVYGVGTDTQDYPAKITFRVKDTVSSQEYGAYIAVYNDHNTSASNGSNMVINPGGNAFIGSGESPASLYALKKATTTEHLFLTADSTMYLYANAATIANRVGIAINTSGHILPQKAEAAHTNALNIGANNNYFANIYSRWLYANAGGVANDGGISLYSNANTTYFIAMRGTGTATGQLGTHGYVTNDYATYFGMSTNSESTPNRGWIFRETRTGLNVASISTRGWAQFNGICLNRANDTGSDRIVGSSKIHHGFLSWYGYNWKNWVTYMSDSTNNSCPTGGKPSTLGKVTSWALRSVIQNSSGYGWVWEASAITTTAEADPTTKPTALMALDSNFGQLRIAQKGTTNANTQTAGLVISSAENGGSTDTAIELWRGSNVSWQIRNSGGVLYFMNNYSGSTVYNVNSLILDHATGAGSIPYLAIGQTTRNTSYRLYVNGTSYLGGNTIIKGHLTPDADSTYDVGSTSKHWRYGYYDGLFVSTQTGFTSTTGNAGVSGTFFGPGYAEMVAATPYIDFHQGDSTADYSARIISDGANRLTIDQGGTPASLSYNSRSITPLLRVAGALYSSSTIESAEYFLNNRSSAGGGFYIYGNNKQYGRFYMQTVGTTSAVGITQLEVGNTTASGTANNARGRVYVYGQTASIKMALDPGTYGNFYMYATDASTYYKDATGGTAVNYWQIYNSDHDLIFRTHTAGNTTTAGSWRYIKMFQNGGLALNATGQSVTPLGGSAITFILRAEGSGYFDGDVYCTSSFIANATSSTKNRGFIARNNSVQYARMYVSTVGTAGDGTNNGTTGIALLILGNSTAVAASGGADNARGLIRVYGANANYTDIYAQANGNRTFYLPNYAGTMYAVHAGSNSALGGAQQPVYIAANGRATACTSYTDALDGRYVNVSGDTMTGQLLTSFKKSVAMGSYQAAATTVAALIEEVRYSSGCMGSVSLSAAYTATAGGTIAAGWYNFIYSPHRSGGVNGAASGDNHSYGTLMLMGMTVGSAHWRIRLASGAIAEVRRVWNAGDAVTGAVWNDYAECRQAETEEAGYVLYETGKDDLKKTTERLQHFAGVSSDTWGFSQGETEKAKTPIAVAGRVLVYPYQDRNNYQPGDCVCAAPGGTVDIMTREEVVQYPDRIVGTVSCVPDYEEWGGGEGADRDPVKVNGRIWIKVR